MEGLKWIEYVTELLGKALWAHRGALSAFLAQELATARRFVAEQQFVWRISGKLAIIARSRLCFWLSHP